MAGGAEEAKVEISSQHANIGSIEIQGLIANIAGALLIEGGAS